MNAIVQKQRCSECSGEKTEAPYAPLAGDCVCAATARTSLIIESPPGQSWAEFCEQLEQPAFLYPVTGFGDLE